MKITCKRLILFGKEIDSLKKFYCRLFGFKVIEEIKNEWVVLGLDGFEIGLHRFGKATTKKAFHANSNSKLVFTIEEGRINSFKKKLEKSGVQIKYQFEYGGFYHMDGEDPEGNVFQVKQKLNI